MVTVTHRPLLALCCFRNVHNECLKRLSLLLWACSSPAAPLQTSSTPLQYRLLHPSLKSVSCCYVIIFHLHTSWEAECRGEHHSLEVEQLNCKWGRGNFWWQTLPLVLPPVFLCVSVCVFTKKMWLFMHNYWTQRKERHVILNYIISICHYVYRFKFSDMRGMGKKVKVLMCWYVVNIITFVELIVWV